MSDPIVAEIRSTRERLALEAGGDIHAIAAAARERQKLSGTTPVSRPARRMEAGRDNPLPLGGETDVGSSDPSSPVAT
jgi:hypothetical protein